MKRWHEELSLFRRRFWSYESWNRAILDKKSNRPVEYGRFRKRKPLDCGKTQCKLCHLDKFPKRYDTNQELIADLKFKEGLVETGR